MTLTETIDELYKALDEGEDVLNVLADALYEAGQVRSAHQIGDYVPVATQGVFVWRRGGVKSQSSHLPRTVFDLLTGGFIFSDTPPAVCYDTLSEAYRALAKAFLASNIRS